MPRRYRETTLGPQYEAEKIRGRRRVQFFRGGAEADAEGGRRRGQDGGHGGHPGPGGGSGRGGGGQCGQQPHGRQHAGGQQQRPVRTKLRLRGEESEYF